MHDTICTTILYRWLEGKGKGYVFGRVPRRNVRALDQEQGTSFEVFQAALSPHMRWYRMPYVRKGILVAPSKLTMLNMHHSSCFHPDVLGI